MKYYFNLICLSLTFLLSTSTVHGLTNSFQSGETTVKLNSSFTTSLTSLGINVSAISPSKINENKASFKVVEGVLDFQFAQGEIIHSGGLNLTSGSTIVLLQNFIIDLTSSSDLTASVVFNGIFISRLSLFNVQLSSCITLPLLPQKKDSYTFKCVKLTLTSAGAIILNQAFNTTTFVSGLTIGTAKIKLKF